MDIKDNTALFKRKEQKSTEVCRVCGSKEIHSASYNNPTMDCIKYLRKIISDFEWEKYPDNMGK